MTDSKIISHSFINRYSAEVVFFCDEKAVGARSQKGLRRVFSGKRAGLRGARFSSGGSKGVCLALAVAVAKAAGAAGRFGVRPSETMEGS